VLAKIQQCIANVQARSERLPFVFQLYQSAMTCFNAGMSILNLTPTQLREAAVLQEKIAQFQANLSQLLGSETVPVSAPVAKPGKRKMSATHIAKIRAAQKLRWAKVNAAKAKLTVALKSSDKPISTTSTQPVKKGPKKMSAEARAKIAAAQTARWAKVRANKTAKK